ncbi:MAG TPA: hypothetical protein VNO32_41660 [Candidatus Acidoferrum sp.]|nr:hypothetical protein [Candidatus Acidoferrum sp.]
MSLAPLDLVSAHPWRRVAFTAYALSLSFFEAVILDALVRGGGREALILADVHGIRASLSEQGAHRVGKDYEVEPVFVSSGVFHPKISVLTASDECHLLVGSGNLTFGGWGGNCEVLEHLHPSFAADAIADAASFFDLISVTERVRHCASEQCDAIATELRRSVQGKSRNGNIRLFHNLDTSITDQISQAVGELGGATRMVAAAPFWDDGSAIDRLCKAIGLDHVFVHAHPYGCVEGFAGSNWPTGCRSKVHAIQLELMDAQGPRRLHAKVFEIICKRGRVLLSGSANGTTAALDRNRNVEACVVRIQREAIVGWRFRTADPPELQTALDDQSDSDEETLGVLRAVLEADEVAGEVLVPKMSGPVSVFHVTSVRLELLGQATLSTDGAFRISAPALEEQSWVGGRLVIRVRDKNGRQAEGFTSVASFGDITRRAGLIGRRLFAVLAGTETPEDVAAIMSWFYEDPQRLGDTVPVAISGGVDDSSAPDDETGVVAVEELRIGNKDILSAKGPQGVAANRNWSRFMNHVFMAFREKRGPIARTESGEKAEDEAGENAEAGSDSSDDDPVVERSLSVFDQLFNLLLSSEITPRNAIVAFDLTQYVCERLRPEVPRVKAWLERLVNALLKTGVPAERRDDVAAAILLLLAMWRETSGYRWARDCLLRLNVDFSGDIPSTKGVQGFQSILPQNVALDELWSGLQQIRTYPEQVRAYLLALKDGKPTSGYSDLAKEAREEWPILEDAFTSEISRKKILELSHWQESCPRCQISLPTSEVFKLQSLCIATAKNCCRRILIWTGD